jgi:hypothetical protein
MSTATRALAQAGARSAGLQRMLAAPAARHGDLPLHALRGGHVEARVSLQQVHHSAPFATVGNTRYHIATGRHLAPAAAAATPPSIHPCRRRRRRANTHDMLHTLTRAPLPPLQVLFHLRVIIVIVIVIIVVIVIVIIVVIVVIITATQHFCESSDNFSQSQPRSLSLAPHCS